MAKVRQAKRSIRFPSSVDVKLKKIAETMGTTNLTKAVHRIIEEKYATVLETGEGKPADFITRYERDMRTVHQALAFNMFETLRNNAALFKLLLAHKSKKEVDAFFADIDQQATRELEQYRTLLKK